MRRKERKSDNGTFFTIPVIISGIVLLLILFGAVFAKFIAPYNPEANDYSAALARAFTQGHLLGTDKLLWYAPVLLASGIITGVFTGLGAMLALPGLHRVLKL